MDVRTILTNVLLAGSYSLAAAQATPQPSSPAIFAVGFTDITDTSARLVFTTTEPTRTTVEVLDQATGTLVEKIDQPAFDEIHTVPIIRLTRGVPYRVKIVAAGSSGGTSTRVATLTPGLRPASTHAWPGYTIFSSTINGEYADDSLNLLAASGARMARVEISWDGVYPQRGKLNSLYLDKMLARIVAMKARGIEPLVLLDYSVGWSKTYTDKTMTWRNRNFGPPDELADWEDFVRTVVTAVCGSTRYYEIWNEPDAGYLATGAFVERPNLPTPIGRPPFKDNWSYWLGDRYVPLIESARGVIDALEPNALVMNGGWNRDYSGMRGDILLDHGVAPYLDDYAYHVYSHSPVSFSRWFQEVDQQFRANIDRIFAAHHVNLPLTVTEWGWAAWSTVPEGKGFGTFEDSKRFYLKSTFYFLSMERFEILSQFALGIGPDTRDHDPLYFLLVNSDSDKKPEITPTYATFQWLAKTFGSRPYKALPVTIPGPPAVKAYAIQMKDTGEIYLAAWQDGGVDDKGIVSPSEAKTVQATLAALPAGKLHLSMLDENGATVSEATLKDRTIEVALPAATATAESGIFLARITKP